MPDGSVLLVEIAAGLLTRIGPDGHADTVAELGGGPNGAAIGPDGHCYVCNNGGLGWLKRDGLCIPSAPPPPDWTGGSIQRVNLSTGQVELLYTHCDGRPLRGPNDLVFDQCGGFWFTDSGKLFERTADRGGVYYAQADGGGIRECVFPAEFPNGVALSPAEDMLYVCETLNGRLWRFRLSGPGQLLDQGSFADPANLLYAPGGYLGFDSMAVEDNGNICQATLFNGGISVVSPLGELVEFVALPDPLVTNLCFGGAELRYAYITLSATGRLVRMPWPRAGLALNHALKI